MLETIIAKLLNYLGDTCGFDYDDLQHSCDLTFDEMNRCKEIVDEQNKYL